ncbi:hypothetical protein [Plastoroseomonas arctica]|uniref:Uncharacterized protein n=1 Tax=Plastoroseomonas arctica TaxID=1509237 RepID=A0AAF1JW59_9PROT|nr:hypothetical protein [Plastoroseomonas arctica]MBR0654949.1 hypothetical protein [Plastoroseomonas arctica]
MRTPMPPADPPPPPPMPPRPTPGLAAWTNEGLRGPVRLPWLPDDLARMPVELVLCAICAALAGLVIAFRVSGAERLLAIVFFAIAAWLVWGDAGRRAARRARTFIDVDPARGVLRVANAESGLDIDLPFGALGAVAVRRFADGAHVMVRRRDAPDVLISGALAPAAAQEAAAALARRLGVPCDAAPTAPMAALTVAVPDVPVANPDPPPEVPDPPHAQHIPLSPNPVAAGRMALWVGGFVVLCGLFLLLMSGAPAFMRLGGLGVIVLGLATMRLQQPWEEAAREQAVVVDHVAGTVTLRGLAYTDILRTRVADPVVLSLAAVRRVAVFKMSEEPGLAIDVLDRPRVMLPAGGCVAEVEALAQRLAATMGCPVEEAQ